MSVYVVYLCSYASTVFQVDVSPPAISAWSQAASRPNCESSNVRSRCPPLDPDQLVAAGTTRCFQKNTGWWLSHLKNEFVSWDDDIPNMMGKTYSKAPVRTCLVVSIPKTQKSDMES